MPVEFQEALIQYIKGRRFNTPKKVRPKKQFRLDMDYFDYDVVLRI